MSVALLPEWLHVLPLQQQAVVLLALRGPDGFPKEHGCKPILRFYRACILKAASIGRLLTGVEEVDTFMSRAAMCSWGTWEELTKRFREVEDELPVHYYTHFMHGAQVLAYKHPEKQIRARWLQFYFNCCNYLHVPPESEPQMDKRLNDFGRELNEVLES